MVIRLSPPDFARKVRLPREEVAASSAQLAAALADRLTTAEQAQRKSVNDLDTMQVELAAAQRRAERAEAEAALARQLLAELRVAPPGARRWRCTAAQGRRPGADREASAERKAGRTARRKAGRASRRLEPGRGQQQQ